MTLGRRGLIAGGLALAAVRPALAAQGVPASGRLAFQVKRKGDIIGSHTLDFQVDGTDLDVRIDVRLAIKFGPVTLFRYQHSGVARWQSGRFASIETQTDNDGEALRVKARRDGAQVIVESSKHGTLQLPGDTLPLTHWSRDCMTAPLFNPQDGKPMRLTVRPRGTDQVALADGTKVIASRFALTGEATIDDWYDAGDVWTALRAVADDRSVLEYRRTA